MTRCAFLSLQDPNGWFIDDALAIPELERLGWQVDTVPWRTASDWNRYDLVIVRSTWDYQQASEEFFGVLEQIDRSSAELQNERSLMRWNADKRYLLSLANKGVPVVPTRQGRSLRPDEMIPWFAALRTDELVVKPCVGANADRVHRIRHAHVAADLVPAARDLDDRLFLIQPFLPAILSEGEYSAMFFAGEYSHCVVKKPGPGDYRVQEEHGGSAVGVALLPDGLLDTARQALACVGRPPLYARVDLVRTDDGFGVMEVELIEPALFFRQSATAPSMFAAAVDRWWHEHRARRNT